MHNRADLFLFPNPNTTITGAMKAVAAFQEAQTKGKAIVLITDEVCAASNVHMYVCAYSHSHIYRHICVMALCSSLGHHIVLITDEASIM